MPSVIMYDIDDPKTRQIVSHYAVVNRVPALILINHQNSSITVYEDQQAKELIDKAIQVINTQKTVQHDQKKNLHGTPIDQIGQIAQDNTPKTSMNTRIQPSEIIETREDMARSSTLPPVSSDRSSAIKNSKVLSEAFDSFDSQPQQQEEGMSIEDIVGGNPEANVSRAALEKSKKLNSAAQAEIAQRDSIMENENMKRRPQPM